MSHEETSGRSVLYRGVSKWKGPEVGTCLTCLKRSKKDIVARMLGVVEEGRGRNVGPHSYVKDFGF